MAHSPPVPFFEGSLDQVRELQAMCKDRGFIADPVQPPGGCGNS